VVFENHECGPVFLQIEPAQDLNLHALSVDREEIDLNWRRFGDNIVECRYFDFDSFRAGDFAFDIAHVRPGVGFRDIENCFPNLVRRAHRHLPYHTVLADFPQFFATTWQWLNQNPFPTTLLKQPRLTQARWMVRAHFHKKSIGLAVEIIPDDLVFVVLGEGFSWRLCRSGQSVDTVKILVNEVKVFYDGFASMTQSATIFLDFCDLGRHESKTEHWLLKILQTRFDVRVTTSPDFIIYGDVGDVHRMYTCHKIYIGAEEPKFSECDFAINIGKGKWKMENGKVLRSDAQNISAADKLRLLDFFQKIFEIKTPPIAAKRWLFGRWLLVRRIRTIPL
jgi:hypothetical protein